MARGLAGLHAAGDLDRAREQQQLFRERGLARVGVGNDGESAPRGCFAQDFRGFGHQISLRLSPAHRLKELERMVTNVSSCLQPRDPPELRPFSTK